MGMRMGLDEFVQVRTLKQDRASAAGQGRSNCTKAVRVAGCNTLRVKCVRLHGREERHDLPTFATHIYCVGRLLGCHPKGMHMV